MRHESYKPPRGSERKVLEGLSRRAIDAELQNQTHTWAIKDSGLEETTSDSRYPFASTFNGALPEGHLGFRRYIEQQLEPRKGQAIGVELGGTGSSAFSEFTPGFFARSIGVSLADHRLNDTFYSKDVQQNVVAEDAARNHEVLVADAFGNDTPEKMKELLRGEKIDLIIERMVGGWKFIHQEPVHFAQVFESWYELLNTGGLMFIDVPPSCGNLVKNGLQHLKEKLGDSLEIQTETDLTFRLKKLNSAPEQLPGFGAKTIKRWAEGS